MSWPDLVGSRYGRLVVLRQASYDDTPCRKYRYWYVVCDCGRQPAIPIVGHSLTQGKTRSCGCLRRERASERLRRKPIYRTIRTPELVERCQQLKAEGMSYRAIGRSVGVNCRTVHDWINSK